MIFTFSHIHHHIWMKTMEKKRGVLCFVFGCFDEPHFGGGGGVLWHLPACATATTCFRVVFSICMNCSTTNSYANKHKMQTRMKTNCNITCTHSAAANKGIGGQSHVHRRRCAAPVFESSYPANAAIRFSRCNRPPFDDLPLVDGGNCSVCGGG